MAINFPSTSGQATDGSFTHTASGITWAWDGTTWKATGVTSSYTLPVATANDLGGIKVGNNLSISSGVLNATDTDTQLSTEQVQDIVGGMFSGNTETNITATYEDSDGTIDLVATGGGSGEPEITWTLGANGSTDYTFTGSGFTSATNDPTLYLIRGQTYKFDNQTGGHPFRIQSTGAASGGGTAYNTGVTNNDATGGTATNVLTFVVPMDAPDTLYYQCTAHPAMTGTINVITQGSSGLQSRTTATGSTGSIAANTSAGITISVAKTYVLHKIQTDAAAWVVVYTDTTSRTVDANRTELEDPVAGAGVIAEVVTVGAVTQMLTPGTIGFNNDGTPSTNAYLKVVNKSGGTNTINVTLHFLQLEA